MKERTHITRFGLSLFALTVVCANLAHADSSIEADILRCEEDIMRGKGSAEFIRAVASDQISAWRQVAEQNSPEGLWLLGRCYFLGAAVKEQRSRSVIYYKRAAALDYPMALSSLALMHRNGHGGLKQNDKEAVRLFKLAAKQGYASAQNSLGYSYEEGLGVSKNKKEAVRLYKLAAKQGHARAQTNLGRMYEHGRGGLSTDPKAAARLYKQAANAGNARAQNNLGWLYAIGLGVDEDIQEALRLWRLSAEQGEHWAFYNLGRAYRDGTGVNRDFKEAVRNYRVAADGGHQESIEALDELGADQRSGFLTWFTWWD
jgi:hypothetical protein